MSTPQPKPMIGASATYSPEDNRLRLYLPQKAILDGTWKPPPVEVVTG